MPTSSLLTHLSKSMQTSGNAQQISLIPHRHQTQNLENRTQNLSPFRTRFSAAVAEMLVQSSLKDLHLLPALPAEKWAEGCVKGLKVRGGVTVSVCWSGGELDEFGIWSSNGGGNGLKVLHYRGATAAANISSGSVYTFNKHLECTDTRAL